MSNFSAIFVSSYGVKRMKSIGISQGPPSNLYQESDNLFRDAVF